VRMATIVGFVGGGGIGLLLLQQQQLLRWHNVGLLIWLIRIRGLGLWIWPAQKCVKNWLGCNKFSEI